MSGNSYLLDTNIIIAYLRNDSSFHSKLGNVTIYLSTIVLGELYTGAYKSQRSAKNLIEIENMKQLCVLLTVDTETARFFGQVSEKLRSKGKPIPTNDIWIAATALQHDLILASRDQHFSHIDGLKWEAW